MDSTNLIDTTDTEYYIDFEDDIWKYEKGSKIWWFYDRDDNSWTWFRQTEHEVKHYILGLTGNQPAKSASFDDVFLELV